MIKSRFLLLSCLGLVSALIWPRHSSAQSDADLRVLFLGNSTYVANGGSLDTFVEYCRASGITCEALHTYDIMEGNRRERRVPPFLPGLARDPRVQTYLSAEVFDFVVLWSRHQAVDDGMKVESEKALQALREMVTASGATTVLPTAYPPLPQSGEFERIQDGFQNLISNVNSVPADSAGKLVLSIPLAKLWKSGIDKFGSEAWLTDRVHWSPLGQYAMGCLWYAFLVDRDPRQLQLETKADQIPLDPETISWIHETVYQLWYSSKE